MVMEIKFADHGIPWKNHGIVFLNFCGNPVFSDFYLCVLQMTDTEIQLGLAMRK